MRTGLEVFGDGLDDLLVGAYDNDDGGTAYLILGSSLGSTAEIDLSDADYSFVGETSSDFAGCSVSGAGDVDGDGLDDLLVGAYGLREYQHAGAGIYHGAFFGNQVHSIPQRSDEHELC